MKVMLFDKREIVPPVKWKKKKPNICICVAKHIREDRKEVGGIVHIIRQEALESVSCRMRRRRSCRREVKASHALSRQSTRNNREVSFA